MKYIYTLLLVLAGANVNAAIVTIDFEDEFTGSSSIGPTYSSPTGFIFTPGSPGGFDISSAVIAGNAFITAIGIAGPDTQPLVMRQTSGEAFGLLSLDLGFCPESAGSGPGCSPNTAATIMGFDAVGNIVTQQFVAPVGPEQFFTNATFDSSWSNIYSVGFLWTADFRGAGAYGVAVDNIVVDVVPIPAAAWLFGSSLLGLGWLGRIRTRIKP